MPDFRKRVRIHHGSRRTDAVGQQRVVIVASADRDDHVTRVQPFLPEGNARILRVGIAPVHDFDGLHRATDRWVAKPSNRIPCTAHPTVARDG